MQTGELLSELGVVALDRKKDTTLAKVACKALSRWLVKEGLLGGTSAG